MAPVRLDGRGFGSVQGGGFQGPSSEGEVLQPLQTDAASATGRKGLTNLALRQTYEKDQGSTMLSHVTATPTLKPIAVIAHLRNQH